MLELLLKTEKSKEKPLELSDKQLIEIYQIYLRDYGFGKTERGIFYMEKRGINNLKDHKIGKMEYHVIPKARFNISRKGNVLKIITQSQEYPERDHDKRFYQNLSKELVKYEIEVINPHPKRQKLDD